MEAKLSNLANEVHGTRAVQKFVEEGVKRNRSDKILLSLRDHVEPLSRSVTGEIDFEKKDAFIDVVLITSVIEG